MASGGIVGCTFLVEFVDDVEAETCDGGPCEGAPGLREDAGDRTALDATVTDPGDASTDAPGSLEEADAGPYAPCEARPRGTYCATNGFREWRGTRDDLVVCDGDGGVTSVRTCTGGCTTMPLPFPDMCNPCPGQANGVYCGHDLAAVPPISREVLFGCRGGNVTTIYPCPNGCNITSSPPLQRACYRPAR